MSWALHLTCRAIHFKYLFEQAFRTKKCRSICLFYALWTHSLCRLVDTQLSFNAHHQGRKEAVFTNLLHMHSPPSETLTSRLRHARALSKNSTSHWKVYLRNLAPLQPCTKGACHFVKTLGNFGWKSSVTVIFRKIRSELQRYERPPKVRTAEISLPFAEFPSVQSFNGKLYGEPNYKW